jgi:hypothetical protein
LCVVFEPRPITYQTTNMDWGVSWSVGGFLFDMFTSFMR